MRDASDDLQATGDAWLITPNEARRLNLPVIAGAFVVGIERRCGQPAVVQCTTLADAVKMLNELRVHTLEIFCSEPEQAQYDVLAKCIATTVH